MSYIVTAPLVIAKKQDGSDLYLYKDAQVPDFIAADDIGRFERLDMVEKVDGRSSKTSVKPASESN